MSHKLQVKIPSPPATSYPIMIDGGLIEKVAVLLPRNLSVNKVVVITDNTVKKHYGNVLVLALKKHGYDVLPLSFPAGEKSKNQQIKQHLEEQMLRYRCGRDTLCIALGGGVVGDITGFIAATYMRGIPYVQLPTTLLAMVDSSVGGKTGIDTPYGKNLLGAFWQPLAVLADTHCLKTLPKKRLVEGLVEAVKMFMTSDAKSFQYAQAKLAKALAGDEAVLQNFIHRAVRIKADVVGRDEKESGLRMILNFGHTIGHALEQVSDYELLHGYAVGLGILVEAKISQLLGLLDEMSYTAIVDMLKNLGIHRKQLQKYDIDAVIAATRMDKKTRTGKVRYVLLKKIGVVQSEKGAFAHLVDEDIVRKAFSDSEH